MSASIMYAMSLPERSWTGAWEQLVRPHVPLDCMHKDELTALQAFKYNSDRSRVYAVDEHFDRDVRSSQAT